MPCGGCSPLQEVNHNFKSYLELKDAIGRPKIKEIHIPKPRKTK